MHEMKTKHPPTWKELEDGSISVTKSEIPFVSVGADHACEHLNRMMKVRSGLVGISNNANAGKWFFLASPEMSFISTEFKGQFGLHVNRKDTMMYDKLVSGKNMKLLTKSKQQY